MNKNLLGNIDLSTDTQYFTKFGGDNATITSDKSAWQLADGKQVFTLGSGGSPTVWRSQVWRLANLSDSLRSKFVGGQTFTGHSGHRFWRPSTTTGLSATESGNSEKVTFMFEDA
jgi:hypothetical protein